MNNKYVIVNASGNKLSGFYPFSITLDMDSKKLKKNKSIEFSKKNYMQFNSRSEALMQIAEIHYHNLGYALSIQEQVTK